MEKNGHENQKQIADVLFDNLDTKEVLENYMYNLFCFHLIWEPYEDTEMALDRNSTNKVLRSFFIKTILGDLS